MGGKRTWGVLGAGALTLAVLGACASGPDRAGPASDGKGLFRAQGPMSGDLGPSPSAGWYVAQQSPRYVKMGLAGRHPERRGLGGWLSRAFGRTAGGAPAAVIAETAALPLPSVVRVENVRTGASVTLRIEERARLDERLISLNPAAAKALGAEAGQPLLVRVRYVEPVLAYRDRPSLTYAGLRRARPETALAAAKPAPAPAAEAPIPTAVRTPAIATQLAEARAAPPAAIPSPKAQPTPAARPAPAPLPSPLRVQAGAFANPDNARRAVAMLAPAGVAAVETVKRGESTLYRVFLRAPAEPAAAEALRAHVVRIGFSDARIVRAL